MAWTKKVPVIGFTFGMIDKSTGGPVTTGTTTAYITINGGAQTTLVDSPVHEGNGQWSVDISSAEMDGEVIGLVFVNMLAVPCYFTILTESAGSRQVDITIDDGTNPIPDVDVSIFDVSNSVYLTGGTSSSSGIVSVGLNDGTYKVRMRKAGVVFTVPETLVVSGDTDETFSGVAITVGVPDDSDTCRVYDYCYDLSGSNPLIRVDAVVKIAEPPYHQDGKYHYVKQTEGVYNATTGLVYWDIAQGAVAKFEIVEIGLKKTATIPALSSALLSSL